MRYFAPVLLSNIETRVKTLIRDKHVSFLTASVRKENGYMASDVWLFYAKHQESCYNVLLPKKLARLNVKNASSYFSN